MTTEGNSMEVSLVLKSRLKELLRSKAVTAAELSRRSGVPKQVLSIWLTGVEPRKLSHLKRVANALGVTVDELCFPSQSESKKDPTPPCDWIEGVFEGVFEGRLLRRPRSR
jgi:transcriptional regulator with XRE-family HTH domain